MRHRTTLQRRTIVAIALLAALAFCSDAYAQEGYKPTAENLAAREWFEQARFGMFIHWGVYSTLGRGEWVMNIEKIPISEYEKVPPQFNPTKFDAAAWVSLAKSAGMKYITITSKHHDGFAMFHSKVSDWNIVDRTPFKRDPLQELADECNRQGIKLFFYYSQLDWHNPDYFPRGETGRTAGRPESGDWEKYLGYMDSQLSELLTNYGPIGGIWFDGMWDKRDAPWHLDRTYGLIHRLQPSALVGSNHHLKPFPGEDFQMFEKDLPGQKTSGFNANQEVGALPLETCETINNSWGYNASDTSYKSTKDLVRYLVRAAGNDANFLLNIGPRPDGTIQPEFGDRLREVGAWLGTYGISVYGTRGGPIAQRPWGVTTRRGNTVFVHILDWPDATLALPPFPQRVTSARFLKDGSAAAYTQSDDSFLVKIPPSAVDPYDTVLQLELAPASR